MTTNPYESLFNRSVFEVLMERVEAEFSADDVLLADFEARTNTTVARMREAFDRGDEWVAGVLFGMIAQLDWSIEVVIESDNDRVRASVDLRGVLDEALANRRALDGS